MIRIAPVAAVLLVAVLLAHPALSREQLTFFRIGTGSIGETHFPIGGLIANAISNPPGSRECEKGGSCGVPGLIAVAQSTDGAVANIRAMAEGRLEAALVQADIAYWAFHGIGPFAGEGAVADLRSVAMVYIDSVHVVTRADAGIAGIGDLRGKRLSVGEGGSGTPIAARAVLGAWGLTEADMAVARLRPAAAAAALARDEIDAFFVVDGPAAPVVAELARSVPIALLPIDGPQAEALRRDYPFFQPGSIPADTYPGIGRPVPTVEIGVVLLVSAAVPYELVYGVTRALWHPTTQRLLAQGHPRGRLIKLDAAIARLGIQLHAGAAGFYFDIGMGP